MSLANVSIVGNLVRMPEQMCFASGKIKTTLTVAVNSFGKPSRGGDAADFYRVEAWGKLAELAGKYLEKGNQVAVSGRLLFDRFTDQQGKNRVVPVVEANQLSLPPRAKEPDSVENGEKDSATNVALAAMSGHLVIDSDSGLKTEIDITSDSDSNESACLNDACSAEEFKVVTMEEKVKVKNKKQAVLSV